MVRVKAFPKNIPFSGNTIFQKGKCIQVFGCLEIRFTENQFRCLVCTNILRKMTSVAVFGSCKSISGKYSIFRKCYFSEGKMFSCVWLPQNSFYGKSIPVLVHSNIFTENALHVQFSIHFLNCKHADNESIPHSFTEETKPSKKIHQIRSNWDRAAEEKMRSRGEGEIGGEIGAIVRRVARSTSGAIASEVSSSSLSLRSGLSLLSLSLSLSPEMIWSENESVKSFSGQRSKYWSTENEFSENFIFRCNQTCGFGGKWFPEIIFTQNKRTLRDRFIILLQSIP